MRTYWEIVRIITSDRNTTHKAMKGGFGAMYPNGVSCILACLLE